MDDPSDQDEPPLPAANRLLACSPVQTPKPFEPASVIPKDALPEPPLEAPGGPPEPVATVEKLDLELPGKALHSRAAGEVVEPRHRAHCARRLACRHPAERAAAPAAIGVQHETVARGGDCAGERALTSALEGVPDEVMVSM